MSKIEIERLKDLSFEKQVAFSYLTCDRLYPNYAYFSENYGFGNPLKLREAIAYLHDTILERNSDRVKIDYFLNEVNRNTPNTEAFTTIFVSSALDACTAILDSLTFLIDKDFLKIINVSTYATDTVSMYVQEIEGLDYNTDKEFQKTIDNHPLMQKEVAIQTGIIAFLQKIKSIEAEDIKILLRLQEDNKIIDLDF